MARTIGEQVYEDQLASGQIQLPDVPNFDYGYTGLIEDDSEFDTPYGTRTGIGGFYDTVKGSINKYGAPIMGGLMSAFSGIPGIGFLMRNMPNDPYAQNRIDMYGAYRDPNTGFIKDKFGYNVGSTLFGSNYMQPGSNSYRSHALGALSDLTGRNFNRGNITFSNPSKKAALDRYYQDTYNKSFEDVYKDTQSKDDPFGTKNAFEGTSDYQGDVQSSGISNIDGGPVSNRTGRGRQGYSRGGLTSL